MNPPFNKQKQFFSTNFGTPEMFSNKLMCNIGPDTLAIKNIPANLNKGLKKMPIEKQNLSKKS